MAFRFEGLEVWHLAVQLSNEADLLTRQFPKKELFSLTTQIKRAADSVALNIAEGSTGQTIPEFRRFLNISLRSAIEVVACLYIAKSRYLVDDQTYQNYYQQYEILCKRITSLRNAI